MTYNLLPLVKHLFSIASVKHVLSVARDEVICIAVRRVLTWLGQAALALVRKMFRSRDSQQSVSSPSSMQTATPPHSPPALPPPPATLPESCLHQTAPSQ
jgi:hypothetical protein